MPDGLFLMRERLVAGGPRSGRSVSFGGSSFLADSAEMIKKT